MAIGVFGTITLIILLIYFSFGLPRISSLADYKPSLPSKILSKNGTVLANLGRENREIAYFDEMPSILIESFLAAEDDNFFEHTGIDYWGILRAMYSNIKAGKVVQGGSTITQQVAKSLLANRRRSIARKIKDFLLARKIEKRFTKQDILFLYLNQIYLGGGYYGVKAAYRGYFGKELTEASVAESAMLAGLLVAPAIYSPYINPERAKARQNYVLRRMLFTEKIDEETYQKAIHEKIKFKLRKKNRFKAGYFTDWIRQRMVNLLGEKEFLTGGFEVKTTLNWNLQQVAEKEVLEGAKKIDRRQGFKGAVGHIDTQEEILKHEKKFRIGMYKKNSNHFTITDEYTKKYEIEFDEEKYWNLKEEQISKSFVKEFPRIVAGNNKKDPLLGYLEKGKSYEAIVVKVNPKGRVIFVSIGGTIGIIPHNHFKWAKERIVSDKKQFHPYIINPATILEEGDIIWTKILNLSQGLDSHLYGPYKNNLKKSKYFGNMKKERYLLCELDQIPEVQGALMSISPQNFQIISMVGGVDFFRSQFNRAIQSKRQPGSAFKPIIYAAALENGFTPSSIIIDSPEALGGADQTLNWKPSNYDGKFKGPVTFRNALEQSRNIPTIKLAQKVGVNNIIEFAKRIKLEASMDKDLSLALGSFGITLKDLTSAYAIFPNGGKKKELKSILSITDRNGELISLEEKKRKLFDFDLEKTEDNDHPFQKNLNETQVYDRRLSYIVSNLLRGVVLHGTAKKARDVGPYLAGKTGTTSRYVDAWFIGYSSNLVTGVWAGLDSNETMGYGESGSKAALPIWMEFMRHAIKRYGNHDFTSPLGIINVRVDKKTGKLLEDTDGSTAFMEAFVEGREPKPDDMTIDDTLIETEEVEEENTEEFLEDDEYYNDG